MPPDRPLHVIVINDFASVTGGSDRVVVGEAVGLARRGHRVTMVAGQGTPDAELTAAGVTVKTTGQPSTLADPNPIRAAARGTWNLPAAKLVAEVLGAARGKDTVVHLHGFTKVLSPSAVRTAVKSGLPIVATLHDYFAACPNGGFFNYQTSEICHLKPLSVQCVTTNCDARAYSHKLWRVGRTAVQRSLGAMPAGVDHLIAPSQFAAEILRPHLPARAHLHVVPNAVPESQMAPADLSENTTFVFLGRLNPDKGPVLFARAARRARVPAVFAGTGVEAEAVREANPDAKVAGWLDRDGVRSAIRSARAVVSASLWYETQGLAALEAAAHGVPAIVPDITVLREVVADGVTGLWFRGGDEDDLADKLTVLSRDDRLAQRLGGAAYDRFWAGHWDVDTHLHRLEQIYGEALRATDANSSA